MSNIFDISPSRQVSRDSAEVGDNKSRWHEFGYIPAPGWAHLASSTEVLSRYLGRAKKDFWLTLSGWLAIALGLCVLIWGITIDGHQWWRKTARIAPALQVYLEKSTRNQTPEYRFLVKNNGQNEVDIGFQKLEVEGFLSTTTVGQLHRLPPQGEALVIPFLDRKIAGKDRVFLSLNCSRFPEATEWTWRYTFQVPEADGQKEPPSYSSVHEGALVSEGSLTEDALVAFEKAVGTCMFMLKKNKDGNFNTVRLVSHLRAFYLIPELNILIFSKLHPDRTETVSGPIPTTPGKDGMAIFLRWDDDKGLMSIYLPHNKCAYDTQESSSLEAVTSTDVGTSGLTNS